MFLMRKIQEITMMRLGIPLSDIKVMSDLEFNNYYAIITVIEEVAKEASK